MRLEESLPTQLELHWNGQLLGTIVEVGWSDWPWASGRLLSEKLSPELREVLQWFTRIADADELEDPPFAQHLVENWWLRSSDGRRYEICVPIVDFQSRMIEWR